MLCIQQAVENKHLLDTVAEAVTLRAKNEEMSVAMDRLQTEISAEYREVKAIEALEREMPGITEVNWSANDTIVIDDS